MSAPSLSADQVRQQLEKILSSAGFARNERMGRFLRFVVEQQLDEGYGQLKETVIGVEVFGRKPDYDPKLDSIVRTEAGRLRTRLAEYYAKEGAADPIVIDLPKGGYAPLIQPRGLAPLSRRQSAILNLEPSTRNLQSAFGRPWGKAALVAGAFVLLAAAWLWLAHRNPEPPVIVVLPFKNLSAEPDSEYFVDGLTDEIIRNLSLIEGLEVRSRTSSFTFKDKPRNVREVGEQLKTNLVVEGSVLRASERLRVNAQLVRVADDVPLWSGRFDRELKDIFTIQDEISRSVVNELRLKLGRGKRRYDTNLETYELYLKARSLLGSTLIPRPNVIKSADLFEQVIAKDPAFAPAYAGLANAYGAISIFTGPRAPSQPGREAAFAKMRPTAERALQLDPLLAEAHAAMGLVYRRELDWASAEKAFRRAIELNPNLTAAYVHLAYAVLCPTGRFEEVLQELDKAVRADPLSADPWEPRASALLYAGRYDETIESCRRGLALDPENFVVKQLQARALLLKGRAAEAIAILEQSGEASKAQLGYAYAITGRRAEAEALAAEGANFPRRRAWIYAGLGDKDRVFEALEEMAARKDPGAQLYLVFPELALIRGDPRLAAFRKKVGLP